MLCSFLTNTSAMVLCVMKRMSELNCEEKMGKKFKKTETFWFLDISMNIGNRRCKELELSAHFRTGKALHFGQYGLDYQLYL